MIGAIDIGGTKIAIGIFDATGKLYFQEEIVTSLVKNDPALAVSLIQAMFQNSGKNIEAIGIGCTGPVYPSTGKLGIVEFLPGWSYFPLVKSIQEACKVPAKMENDANAAALGEWVWGAGKKMNPFMMITIGTGIGVGVVLNGKIFSGYEGFHPEMGHHVIDNSATEECFCGSRGCFESLASGRAMEKYAVEENPMIDHRTAQVICELALKGDPNALRVTQRTAHYLGVGIANLITIWMPEMVCLSGGLMKSSELFLPIIKKIVHNNCGLVPSNRVEITTSISGKDVGLIGAAQVWLCQ